MVASHHSPLSRSPQKLRHPTHLGNRCDEGFEEARKGERLVICERTLGESAAGEKWRVKLKTAGWSILELAEFRRRRHSYCFAYQQASMS